ncbi:MAG: hypothetical protein Q7U75_14980, partial [Desulfobacterales bacterium]|nr:hypothetical protein [Desulfobacterales bacterium]
MGLKAFLTEKLFAATIDKAVSERLSAAGAGTGTEAQWRRLTGNSVRELPIATWQRQVEVCYWLWKLNPLGQWIIETMTDLTAGKGFTYTAKNDEVDDLLESFWYDPVNRMDMNFEQMVRELYLYGVQCWPVFVAEQTGKVRLGMVDPAQIVEIYTDPVNAKITIGCKLQRLDGTGTRMMKAIITGETMTVVSETARQMRENYTDGECFLFAINRVSNDPYGASDLFVIADHLDEYEEFVFAAGTKARKQNAYIWDVKMDGATEADCQKFANDNANPPDGALRVHNEKITWAAVAPDLKALDTKEAAALQRNHILGCKSLPSHWYGGIADVNRAAASEGNETVKAMLDRRQNLCKFIIETIFTYVIQSAITARYLAVPEDEAFDFAVQKPEAQDRDITKVSTAVRDLTTALTTAAASNWVDPESAVKIFAFILAMIGYELDPESMDL